jgi:hypothetical protein
MATPCHTRMIKSPDTNFDRRERNSTTSSALDAFTAMTSNGQQWAAMSRINNHVGHTSFHVRVWVAAGEHRRMARVGHGLPKVLLGSAMPDPSTPCRGATSETALWPIQGWPAHRAGGLRPSSTPLDIPRRTPMDGEGSRDERGSPSQGSGRVAIIHGPISGNKGLNLQIWVVKSATTLPLIYGEVHQDLHSGQK